MRVSKLWKTNVGVNYTIKWIECNETECSRTVFHKLFLIKQTEQAAKLFR